MKSDTMDYKTLAELNPKVGDTVVYRMSLDEYKVGPNQTLVFPNGYSLEYDGWDKHRCFTLKEKDMKIGSLKEIGAMPGDTVELVENAISWDHCVGSVGVVTLKDGQLHTEGKNMNRVDTIGHKFKIIKRYELPYGHVRLPDGSTVDLTAIDKPLGLLSEDVKSALINCKLTYQYFRNNGWDVNDTPCWANSITYRVKPQPKIETVTIRANDLSFGFQTVAVQGHEITFNLIDGVPDCNSIKMEKLK